MLELKVMMDENPKGRLIMKAANPRSELCLCVRDHDAAKNVKIDTNPRQTLQSGHSPSNAQGVVLCGESSTFNVIIFTAMNATLRRSHPML